jgi:hypothetical protein
MVRLMRARPLRVLRAPITTSGEDSLRMPHGLGLQGGNAQGHLVLFELDDEQLEANACDFLFLNAGHFADAVRRIDDVITRA